MEHLRSKIYRSHPQILGALDRRQEILRHLNLSGLGLEIGPSYGPLLPKSEGYRVETVDYADAAHLREKYRDAEVDISKIEDVDYVTGGNSILTAIGKFGRYDYIVASHLIEHVPDMLGFLKDCEQLLKPDGRLSLVVPDKRYCFDLFQAITTTGQILQAHIELRTRPNPEVLFDNFANNSKKGGQLAWDCEESAEPTFMNDLAEAKKLFDAACSSNEYVDAHVWHFVPSSFRLIINDLNAIGELSLQELAFVEAGTFEFFLTLSRQAQGCPFDRLTLAKRVIDEQAQT